jgi:hypothetical protein
MTEPRGGQKCDTLVSLKEYIETRMMAQQAAIDMAKELMEARLNRAEVDIDRRLDVLNHLRSDVLSKTEFVSAHAALTSEFHAEAAGLRAEVAGLKEWKAEQRGKASINSVYLSYALALVSLVIALITMVHDLLR